MNVLWRGFDRLLDLLALIAAAIVPIVFVLIIYDVTTRTLRFGQISWVVAITEYALIYVTALGAPWLLREKGHVSMEAFRVVLPAAVNRVMETIVLLLCLAACAVTAFAAWPVMVQNIGVGDMRASFLTRWLLYLPVLTGFVLCGVQFARFLLTGQSLYKGITAEQDGL
jgi:TRAP-type C4-dicarboxylate transport system permease small subunit